MSNKKLIAPLVLLGLAGTGVIVAVAMSPGKAKARARLPRRPKKTTRIKLPPGWAAALRRHVSDEELEDLRAALRAHIAAGKPITQAALLMFAGIHLDPGTLQAIQDDLQGVRPPAEAEAQGVIIQAPATPPTTPPEPPAPAAGDAAAAEVVDVETSTPGTEQGVLVEAPDESPDEPPEPPAPEEVTFTEEEAEVVEAEPPRLGAREAAERMYIYAAEMIRAGRASELGTRAAPNSNVRALQKAMRLIADEGIYGTQTRARGKELLGRDFPTRTRKQPTQSLAPTPPPPTEEAPIVPADRDEKQTLVDLAREHGISPSQAFAWEQLNTATLDAQGSRALTQKEAAAVLLKYVRAIGDVGRSARLGYRGHPNVIVQTAQTGMGGLTPDGIYGGATRRRGKQLTGAPFPPR